MSVVWVEVTRKTYVPVSTEDSEYIDSLSTAVIAARDVNNWASHEMRVRVIQDNEEIARARKMVRPVLDGEQ